MNEYYYFKQTGTPEIHAAIVGISKEDWVCALAQEKLPDVYQKMAANGFDILPKVNRNGNVHSYYCTKSWGRYAEDGIELKNIQPEDSLYYTTNIKDVIRLMYEQGRNYFFLANYTDVIGLITISNLNCKQVALYYYNLVCSLEKALGMFVRGCLDRDQILHSLEKLGREKNKRSALDTVKRFNADFSKGLDGSIIEYLYLSDLFLLISHHQMYKRLGYKTQDLFLRDTDKLNTLRNSIAHPNKSLVKSRETLNDLWKAFIKIEELEDMLSHWSKNPTDKLKTKSLNSSILNA